VGRAGAFRCVSDSSVLSSFSVVGIIEAPVADVDGDDDEKKVKEDRDEVEDLITASLLGGELFGLEADWDRERAMENSCVTINT